MFAAKNTAAPSGEAVYIESVFSTYLYTGDGSGFSVNNGIDLSTKGGLVWLKDRTSANIHELFDTARGATYFLRSDATNAQGQNSNTLTSFNTNGFNIGDAAAINTSTNKYVSWTFRKQAKFFDVVTYTGNGAFSRTISHNLGSTPGFIIIKETSQADDWCCLARDSSGNYQYLFLNLTTATQGSSSVASTATSTTVDLGVIRTTGFGLNQINEGGFTYVMYLFAHNAGGFGATGADNVISCGSFTADGSGNATVNLGYEPQWVMIKASSTTAPWNMFDVMRGMAVGGSGSNNDQILQANSSGAETASYGCDPSSTGFIANGWGASQTYIYIAIRRGPMKTPTSGTSVFSPNTATGVQTSGFPIDLTLGALRTGGSNAQYSYDRLRGGTQYLITSSTAAEASGTSLGFDSNTGLTYSFPANYVNWFFRRAPGFFDVACYAGNGSTQSVTHNLAVEPELIIVKWRSGGATAYDWRIYHKDLGITKWGKFSSDAFSTASSPYPWDTPTSSVFKLGDGSTWLSINGSGRNFVAYLFASVSGVSKVGSYTGTGTTQVINCGFTAGSRFVMIKRTDSTGDWYVWDTARGIVSGNDPYLLLNDTAAEVTSTDYIDPANSGFEISSTAPAAINANGGSFIFFAVA